MTCLICLQENPDFRCSKAFNREGQATHEFHRECISLYLQYKPPICLYPGCNTNWGGLFPPSLSGRVRESRIRTFEPAFDRAVLKTMFCWSVVGFVVGILYHCLVEIRMRFLGLQ
jgi:hypothetical protein